MIFWRQRMKKSDFESKSDQQLLDLYYQSGGNIDVDHYVTRDELIEALLSGNKLIGFIDRNENENNIY